MDLYRFGIEEEYFVADLRTRNASANAQRFFRACRTELGDQVTSELLQAQIEVATVPCRRIDEARGELERLRLTVSDQAARYGVGIVAAATHPLAIWREQKQTRKDRYSAVIAAVRYACPRRGTRSVAADRNHVSDHPFLASVARVEQFLAVLAGPPHRIGRIPTSGR